MSVEITVTHAGGVDTLARHGPSGAELRTTAPVDNGGDGSSFSPTDLVAAALGSCVITLMALVARRHGIELGEVKATVTKEMGAAPRRIARLPVRVQIGASVDPAVRKQLERAALTCPVHATLGDNVDAPIEFEWTAWP